MSGKLPESDNLEEFWANLIGGVDMVTDDGRRWKPGEWAAGWVRLPAARAAPARRGWALGSGLRRREGRPGVRPGLLCSLGRQELQDRAGERPRGRALRRPLLAHLSRGTRAPGPLWGSRFDTVTPSRPLCGVALPDVWGVSQRGGARPGGRPGRGSAARTTVAWRRPLCHGAVAHGARWGPSSEVGLGSESATLQSGAQAGRHCPSSWGGGPRAPFQQPLPTPARRALRPAPALRQAEGPVQVRRCLLRGPR